MEASPAEASEHLQEHCWVSFCFCYSFDESIGPKEDGWIRPALFVSPLIDIYSSCIMASFHSV